MTIQEQYALKVKREKEAKQVREEKTRKALADSIETKVFLNESLKKEIVNNLLRHGRVTVTGLGCLCQGGLCTWQKGFTNYLTKYHHEWAKEGVTVHYGIDGVIFTAGATAYGHSINIKDFLPKED